MLEDLSGSRREKREVFGEKAGETKVPKTGCAAGK